MDIFSISEEVGQELFRNEFRNNAGGADRGGGIHRMTYDDWWRHTYTPGTNPNGEDLTMLFRQALLSGV